MSPGVLNVTVDSAWLNVTIAALRLHVTPESMSRGEYVTFVDSDDVIARDYVTRLYAMMADADMAVTRVGGKMRHCDSEPLIMSRDDAMKSLLYQDGIDSSVSGKMFARHLFDEERFTPESCMRTST